jgi:hypothetical protein
MLQAGPQTQSDVLQNPKGGDQMNRKLFVLAAVFSIFLFTGVASAQNQIPKMMHNQQEKINQGVRDGSLTPGETEIVQDNLNHIKRTYERAVSDGTLDKREIRRLGAMLDENSRMITRKKHNARRLY